MFGWRSLGRSVRRGILTGLLVILLLALAKLHACACTGGPPVWHSVSPTTNR